MPFKNSPSFDYIPSKRQVHLGSPILYELLPVEGKIGRLTRKTLRGKDVTITNKTILLLGETGAGKSTMVNALVNYALGVKWDHDAWFEMVAEGRSGVGDGGLCESRTSDVVVYEVFGFEGRALPFSLTIIDTPGFGNTIGVHRDQEVSGRLRDLFSSGAIPEVNAIGLVLKGGENRLTDRPRYIFDSLMSLFGKDMEKNIVSLITHSDGNTPTDVLQDLEVGNVRGARDERRQLVHFLFNNRQKEERSEDNGTLKRLDQITEKGMGLFMDFLKRTTPQRLVTTLEVLKARDGLKVYVQNLRGKVEVMELKQRGIRCAQENVRRREEEVNNNSNYSIMCEETYTEVISAPEGAVRCLVCKENCHYPCERVYKPGSCMVMKRARCTACPGRCSVSDHVKDKSRYVTRTRKVERIIPEEKARYDRSKADLERAESQLKTLQREMDQHLRQMNQWINEAFNHILKLEKIALIPHPRSTHVHLDFLIERLREQGDTEKVQTLEIIKCRGRFQNMRPHV